MSKLWSVVVVVSSLAACGGSHKQSSTTGGTGASGGTNCDAVGTWTFQFKFDGDVPAACGTDVPWDQPMTVVITRPQDEQTTEAERQTGWANTTVKAGQMLGDMAECRWGYVAAGEANGRDINVNVQELMQTGTTASGRVEINRPAVTDGGEGCSREGTVTGTKK